MRRPAKIFVHSSWIADPRHNRVIHPSLANFVLTSLGVHHRSTTFSVRNHNGDDKCEGKVAGRGQRQENDPYKFMPTKRLFSCKIFENTVTMSMKSQLDQHHKSEKHKNTLLRGKRTASQVQLTGTCSEPALSANILWSKLRHLQVHDFRVEHSFHYTCTR